MSTDTLSIAYREETTFNTVATGGNYKRVAIRSHSMAPQQETVRDTTLDPDRQVTDSVRTQFGAGGGMDFSMRFLQWDDWLGAVIQADTTAGFATQVNVAASTISFDNTSGEIRDSANGFTNAAWAAGNWIYVYGAANTRNNGFWRIESKVSNGALELTGGTDASTGVVDEAAGAAITAIVGGQISNGKTLKSYTVETFDTIATTAYDAFTGCGVNSLRLSATLGEIINGSWDLVGAGFQTAATAFASGYDAAPTKRSMSAVQPKSSVFVDGARRTGFQRFDLEINNGLEAERQLFDLDALGMISGKFNVTGSFSVFRRGTITDQQAMVNFTNKKLAFGLADDDNNGYLIELPALTFDQVTSPAQGENATIVNQVNFQAKKDATLAKTMRIWRFAVV